MLSDKRIPKTFRAEAVIWTFYVLNKCPTLAVKDITPQEAWSGIKPSVDQFRIFGCLAHVHVPHVNRGKLDNKSLSCVFLGIVEETKGYRLFDPNNKKIVVSRDVIFEEEKCWDWDVSYEKQIFLDLTWDEDDKITEEGREVIGTENSDDGGNSDRGIDEGD